MFRNTKSKSYLFVVLPVCNEGKHVVFTLGKSIQMPHRSSLSLDFRYTIVTYRTRKE